MNKIFLFLAILFYSQHSFNQTLPDPFNSVQFQNTTTASNNYDLYQNTTDFPNPSYGRAMAEKSVGAIKTLVQRVNSNNIILNNSYQEYQEAENKLNRFKIYIKKVLKEMSDGLYCSVCWRSKSELEENRENFYEHVKSVGGKVLAAPADKVKSKQVELNKKLNELQNDYQTKSGNYYNLKQQIVNENNFCSNQIREGLNLWGTATSVEEDLIKIHLDITNKNLDEKIKKYDKNIAESVSERKSLIQATGKKSDIDLIETSIKMWTDLKSKILDEKSNAYFSYQIDWKNQQETKAAEYQDLNNSLKQLDNSYFSNLLGTIPVFNISLDRVSVYSSPDVMGASFKFGKYLSGEVQVSNNDKDNSLEAINFINFFKLKIGLGLRTVYNQNGVSTSIINKVEISNSANDKNIRDEKDSEKLPNPFQ